MKTFDTNTDFSFVMDIAKSFSHIEHIGDTTNTTMFIKGVASSTRRDLQKDRFSRQGLENLQKALEEGILNDSGERVRVPLRSGHREEWEDVLGEIVKAEIDDEDNLWITAQLDEDSYKAQELYRKLSKGKVKLGLSVKGQVTQYHFEWDNDIQKSLPVFNNLNVKEISVTQKPVNPSPYPLAIAKSLLADPNYETALEESMKDVTKSGTDEVLHPAQAENNTELVNLQEDEGKVQLDNAAADANLELRDGERVAQTIVDNTTVDAPDAPQEPQRVATTPAEDANANDVPAGYVAAPHSEAVVHQEAQVAEVASTDPQSADPVAKLAGSVEALLSQVQAIQAELATLKTPIEAQKAEADTATPQESEVEGDNDLDARIALAVTKALEATGFKTLVQELEVVKGSVQELASQPVDKSIAVQKAKDEEDDNDPHVRYRALRQGGTNPIRASLAAAYTPKN